MATIDLYDAGAFADGWHSVRSPGGYEWWYFDAEDAATDTQVVAIFMEGFIFHPGYLRAYSRYLKHPTKLTPPTAGDFPCVYLCIYRGGRIWRQFFTQYRRSQFKADRDRCQVVIGPNVLTGDDAGGYTLTLRGSPWELTARGPQTRVEQTLSANLYFQSEKRLTPTERPFLSRDMTGGAHHAWTIAAPRCVVSGNISVGSSGGKPFEEMHLSEFSGYHDHNYGTAPIGDGLRRWTWGRAMFAGGRTITFHHAEPADTARPSETHVVELIDDALREHAVDRVTMNGFRKSRPALFLQYASTIDFDDVLRLSSPRVIDPSPFYLRLQYEAESKGERTTAFCELAYPHRLRWPILGRMVEMSFDKRETRQTDSLPIVNADDQASSSSSIKRSRAIESFRSFS